MSTQIRSKSFMPASKHSCIGKKLINTFRMHPISLFMSRGQHKIFRQIPAVDIIPESSTFFQDSIIIQRNFWYWACNFLNCIQLITLFEVFSKCPQNRRNQFGRIRVQRRTLHLKVHPVSFPNFLCMLFKVALQGFSDSLQLFVKKPVVFRTYSLDSDPSF